MEPLRTGPILFDDEKPAVIGGSEPPPREEPTPAPQPAAAPQQPATTMLDPNSMAQAILLANQEQARQQWERQQWAERQKQMAAIYEPPAVPQGEAAEALILEAPALAGQFERFGQWASNAMKMQAQALWEATQQQLAQAQAPVYEMRRDAAMDRAAAALEASGMTNGAELISELEGRLRNSPQTYWDLVTNPQALVRGAKLVADERGQQFMGGGPASLGYSPGPQGGNYPAQTTQTTPEIELAEQLLRRKIRPEYRERLFNSEGWNR